jgi:hypothetical protein
VRNDGALRCILAPRAGRGRRSRTRAVPPGPRDARPSSPADTGERPRARRLAALSASWSTGRHDDRPSSNLIRRNKPRQPAHRPSFHPPSLRSERPGSRSMRARACRSPLVDQPSMHDGRWPGTAPRRARRYRTAGSRSEWLGPGATRLEKGRRLPLLAPCWQVRGPLSRAGRGPVTWRHMPGTVRHGRRSFNHHQRPARPATAGSYRILLLWLDRAAEDGAMRSRSLARTARSMSRACVMPGTRDGIRRAHGHQRSRTPPAAP